MARDHFAARTHLKHFGDPSENDMLNAYRKMGGAAFPCWPADACHGWDGDMNSMMDEADLLSN
jgi:hypothetical protein